MKKYDEAIILLEKATILIPESYFSYYNLAFCYKNKQKYDEARKYIEKSVELNPDYIESQYMNAQIYIL